MTNPETMVGVEESSATIFWYKVQCMVIIGITGLIGGVIPLQLRIKDRWLSLGNTLAGGIFLSAGLAHMLPESIEGFKKLGLSEEFEKFPIPFVLCIFGLVGTMLLEQFANSRLPNANNNGSSSGHSHSHGVSIIVGEDRPSPAARINGGSNNDQHENTNENNNSVSANNAVVNVSSFNMIMLALLLGVHSIIEGIALGVEDTTTDISSLLFAIVSHKVFDAFAFGVSLARYNVPNQKLLRWVGLFSLMTPLGIVMGLLVFTSAANVFSEGIKAVASGTFVYIALIEVLMPEFGVPRDRLLKIALLCGGVILMAMFSTHSHDDEDGDHAGHNH